MDNLREPRQLATELKSWAGYWEIPQFLRSKNSVDQKYLNRQLKMEIVVKNINIHQKYNFRQEIMDTFR